MARTFNDFNEMSTNACRLDGNQYEKWTTFAYRLCVRTFFGGVGTSVALVGLLPC